MRTQASKNSPKKGFSSKSSLKSPTKAAKKKNVTPKKVSQPLKRSLIKVVKKKPNKNVAANKDGSREGKEDKTSSDTDNLESSSPTSSRSQIPSKKVKKEKKKISSKSTAVTKMDVGKKIDGKKNLKTLLNEVVKQKNKKVYEVKYKINKNPTKKVVRTVINTKIATKKENTALKVNKSIKISRVRTSQASPSIKTSVSSGSIQKSCSDPDLEQNYSLLSEKTGNITANNSLTALETLRADVERTPKFFTSSRTPRSLDIDVKSLKASKATAIPDRLISPLCNDHKSGESPYLVNQGPDMDVYTFTEKVDSPKNILSDFRDVSNKNVGKVRPIARVKGTVIDKNQDADKKKCSPHRPIEEVVKQLKANKKNDDVKSQPQKNINTILAKNEPIATIKSDMKAIVSKSYKMVARKSRIPGKPFIPLKIQDQKEAKKTSESKSSGSKKNTKLKKSTYESEDELETSKFSINSNAIGNFSSEESASESNDDIDVKDSSGSEQYNVKKGRTQCTKKALAGGSKRIVSRELRELAKCSGSTSKDNPKKKKMSLLSMWGGPKKHRMASLNAIAKVHCLYENESRTHMELGLMKTVDRQIVGSVSIQKKKDSKSNEKILKENSSESEYDKKEKTEDSSGEESVKNTRTLRGEPGIRSAGKYWDPKFSTSSSEDSELEYIKKVSALEKKKIKIKPGPNKCETEKPSKKGKQTKDVPAKKKRNRNEVVMDFKDMVVHKRMASLNATAILAASYEKRSPKSSKDETTSDSCSDESFSSNSKNGVGSGVKSESKNEDTQNDSESSPVCDRKQKVEVIVNQDTDVTITGVYSTHHHDGFCTVSGMQYRISSTSHTQTTATANCEKESARDDESRYTPLSALSSMKPPADKPTPHTGDLGGLSRRPGCSSAFSAPSTTSHHEPGFFQPAGPLIKETAAEGVDRTLAPYHPPPPHYHPPHPPVLQQYGPQYYPSDLCYGQYYRPAGPYHMRPLQPPDAPMVGVRTEPYPPPQYYGAPPCYQHSTQRLPYIECRSCPCPMNAYPKNVVIGPATGRAPTGGGPGLTNSGAAFLPKARTARVHSIADNHAAGKDPPLEGEPPAAADAPRPCPLPLTLGGASPKRELYEVRVAARLAGEAAGPPSPARGSAGACAPQPPPSAAPPRRARLGKDAARRSLAPDDTALLLQPPATSDDLELSSAPIEISSDESSTPLIDIKKENEGPVHPAHRKNEALALREHNSATTNDIEVPEKPVKRRYSKPQLHIDMIEEALEDACKTNGIGEHVKLQKRRKISTEHVETIVPKKHVTPKSKKTPKATEAKPLKRKLLDTIDDLHLKSLCAEQNVVIDRLTEQDVKEMLMNPSIQRPKNKSALLLDNLIRKNSVDSNNISIEKKINPAELFLPKHMRLQTAPKTDININNNVIENQSRTESNSAKRKKSHRKTLSWYLHDKNRRKSVASKDSEELSRKADDDICQNKVTAETINRIGTPNCDKTVSPLKINKNFVENQTHSESSSAKRKKSHRKTLSWYVHDKNRKKTVINKDSEELSAIIDDDNCLNKVTANTINRISLTCDKTVSPALNINNNVIEDQSHTESNSAKRKKSHRKTLSWYLHDKNRRNSVGNKDSEELTRKADQDICQNKVTAESINWIGTPICDKTVSLRISLKKCQKSPKSKKNKLCDIEKVDIEKSAELRVTDSVESDCVATCLTKDIKKADLNGQLDQLPSNKLEAKSNGELMLKSIEKVSDKTKLFVSKKRHCMDEPAEIEAVEVDEEQSSCLIIVKPRKRRRYRGGRKPKRLACIPPQISDSRAPPRWSNGWRWDGDYNFAKVYLNNNSRLDRTARCWSRMRHASGDHVALGDCVLLRASSARAQPFVARVAKLWENPEDGEMMLSLVWYYRPEHTEQGRTSEDAPDEVFASRHRDANSVACIEDKCYVLAYNEYCRYRKRMKALEEGIIIPPSIVPPLYSGEVSPALATTDTKLPASVSPELIFFCRKIYDFRSKKLQVPTK